jgi:hypothetical protein
VTGCVLCIVDPISRYGRTRSARVPQAALSSWDTLAKEIVKPSDDRVGAVVQSEVPVPGLPAHLVAAAAVLGKPLRAGEVTATVGRLLA